jgi:hypothetical protein
MKSPQSIDVKEGTLTGMTFAELSSSMCTKAPTLWNLLHLLTTTAKQEKWNTHKKAEKVSEQSMVTDADILVDNCRHHFHAAILKITS